MPRFLRYGLVALAALIVPLGASGAPPVGSVGPDERARTLKEVEEVARRFTETSDEFDGEMKSMVLREIRRRRSFLTRSYRKRIDDIDVVQRARRLEAIAALERFIERYPRHPKHTPDAMFRLAELYFEKSQTDNEQLAQ